MDVVFSERVWELLLGAAIGFGAALSGYIQSRAHRRELDEMRQAADFDRAELSQHMAERLQATEDDAANQRRIAQLEYEHQIIMLKAQITVIQQDNAKLGTRVEEAYDLIRHLEVRMKNGGSHTMITATGDVAIGGGVAGQSINPTKE